jgi:endoglucanase
MLAQPPAVGTTVIAPQQSKARIALENLPMDADATAGTTYLAAQPTAYWLTPEQDPIGTVGGTVLDLIAQARDQNRATAMVVYGLPDRDCGNHSAGGLSPADYPRWVAEIGKALKTAPDQQKIIILEPDSIALTSECGDVATRAGFLSGAVDALSSTATWIYIDGGHSAWHSPDEMAQLIRQMGIIDRVRGVATNVSNYQSTYDEFAYAHALSDRLGAPTPSSTPPATASRPPVRPGATRPGSASAMPPGPSATTSWTPTSGSSLRARATASATAVRRPGCGGPPRPRNSPAACADAASIRRGGAWLDCGSAPCSTPPTGESRDHDRSFVTDENRRDHRG